LRNIENHSKSFFNSISISTRCNPHLFRKRYKKDTKTVKHGTTLPNQKVVWQLKSHKTTNQKQKSCRYLSENIAPTEQAGGLSSQKNVG